MAFAIVFAMVARASYSARSKWFQPLDFRRVSCILRGLGSCSQEAKPAQKTGLSFDELAQKGSVHERYGHLLVRPDDRSHAWGVDSFAVLPTSEGEFRRGVAKQCGYRIPAGPWFAVADPDAAVAVPGVAPSIAEIMRRPFRGAG